MNWRLKKKSFKKDHGYLEKMCLYFDMDKQMLTFTQNPKWYTYELPWKISICLFGFDKDLQLPPPSLIVPCHFKVKKLSACNIGGEGGR